MQTDAWLGTLPAWVTAGIAFLALIAASTSAYFSYRNTRNQQKQLEYQQKQLDRLEEDKHKEQASKVAAWVVTKVNPNEGRRVLPTAMRERTFVRVVNGSDLPVYGVWVWVHEAQFERQIGRGALARTLPPGSNDLMLDLPLPLTKFSWVSVVFEDAQGVYWYRDGFGNLTEETEDSVSEIMQDVEFDT